MRLGLSPARCSRDSRSTANRRTHPQLEAAKARRWIHPTKRGKRMSDAALIFKDDGKGGIVMTARYDGGWDYNSKAHMAVYKLANNLGEPTGEPIVEVGDKKAEPKVVLARAS